MIRTFIMKTAGQNHIEVVQEAHHMKIVIVLVMVVEMMIVVSDTTMEKEVLHIIKVITREVRLVLRC